MATVGPATRDSYFTPSVTFCVRGQTAKWARIADEARWVAISNNRRGPTQYAGIAVSRTRTGANDQLRTWSKLLGLDARAVTSTGATFFWLWAGANSCIATVAITQQGPLTVVQVYQHAYNAEYEWPEHLGTEGLRAFILDAIDEFSPSASYSDLPGHVLARLENCVRSRTSAMIAEVGDIALGDISSVPAEDGHALQSIWRLRAALRRIIAGLHDHQPESSKATETLTKAVSELDTLLGVLNTQQLLKQTIADSRARDDQQRRDEIEARRDKAHADREARHDRTLALFATVFIGPSLVFGFFSLPSSPDWKTEELLLSATASIVGVWVIIWLLDSKRRRSTHDGAIGDL